MSDRAPEVKDPERQPLGRELKKLASHSAIYGSADVFTNVVNFLLIPVYTQYLTPSDYGVFALLLPFNTAAKILLRMGLDTAFFRVYYDLDDERDRRRLAGTVFLFAAGVGTATFAAIVFGAEGLAALLAHGQASLPARFVILSALDVYLGVFAFVPLNLLRIKDRPGQFSTLAAARHSVNTILKLVLIVSGWGVEGVLVSDAVATGLFSLALLPVLFPNASLTISPRLLRETLRFGLPKVPHGIMIQAQNNLDRWILNEYVSRAQLGIYQVGYTFGLAVKFALAAFEPAWQPFVFSEMKSEHAPTRLARVITYAWTGFVTLGLGFAVFSGEILRMMTYKRPAYWEAAPIIPVIVLAYLLHGAFLLTSIGIGIRKEARYYPIVTAAAAATNLGFNLLLIPGFGLLGAAWATVAGYFVMAGLGFFFSQRLYPIPLETGRLSRIVLAAAIAYFVSLMAPVGSLAGDLAFKVGALAVFPAGLFATGFLSAEERGHLRRLMTRPPG